MPERGGQDNVCTGVSARCRHRRVSKYGFAGGRAARLLLSRWRELVAARVDFAFESTLSGRTYAAMLRDARSAGYSVHLCYLWLPDVRLSLRRVRQRLRKGGHGVPEADVRRRFLPSLYNFFSLYLPLADETLLLQAAAGPPRPVAWWTGQHSIILEPGTYERIQQQAASAKARHV